MFAAPRHLDRYLIRQMAGVGGAIALTLAGLLLMTQSLRFLELVIDSGASGLVFMTLSLLALPRFFEVILPIAMAAAAVFVYVRLRKDGELTVMQAAGMSPAQIARPGFTLSLGVMALMFVLMAWIAPLTLANLNQLRQVVKAQYSALLFREGVFNEIGNQVTVYVAKRLSNGAMEGVMIYDARPENPVPVTILARGGQLLATQEGQQVVVFNGARQVLNPKTNVVERLNFERYVIDLPDGGPVRQRWAEPEERTITQLLWPRADDTEAREKRQEFVAEIHRRILSPLLAPCFFMVTICLLLLQPFGRARPAFEIIWVAGVILLLQSAYITVFSWARGDVWGIAAMYLVVMTPLLVAVLMLEKNSKGRVES